MQPIHELLNRIRWDPAWATSSFEVGYRDHATPAEVRVPMASVRFDPDAPGLLAVADEEGVERAIPLHRIRTVYRDGRVIWQRPEA
jgi:uncharacterized protein (UPF0248 family)